MDEIEEMDEFSLTDHASTLLRDAETPQEQRQAILMWLRGARLQVSPDERNTAPVDLLISAIETLDLGHAMAVMQPAEIRPPANPYLEAARGRAIAAVDHLVARGMSLKMAATAVDDAIGVKTGTVKRWRETSRSARQLHSGSAAHVVPTLDHWAWIDSLPEKLTLGKVEATLLKRLAMDRPIHLGG